MSQVLSNRTQISKPDQALIPAVEVRRKVPLDWNNTQKLYPEIDSIIELFEAQAARTPQTAAVEFPRPDGKLERLTYYELSERSNQLAHHLQKLGVGPDIIVGVCADRSVEMLIGVLAILKAGGCYASFDPTYPQDRLGFMLEDTKTPIILTLHHLAKNLPQRNTRLFCLDTDWKSITRESRASLPCSTTTDNLAYLIYTSGSTGKPKGVAMRQGPLINLIQWQLENWSAPATSRTLQFASLNFDVSFQEIFSTWCSGGTLVLISEEERRDSNVLTQFLSRHRIERLFLPFVALKHLADAAARNDFYPTHLKEVITAGEQLQLTPQLVHFFARVPNCTLENQYGPSETHVVTAYRLQGSPEKWPVLPPIGRPIANTTVHILNESLKPVPIGDIGELYLGGLCLARGYLNRPEVTAERFIADPFGQAGTRLYKTGDLGRFLPDGNIEFLGRVDHQVKIRGFRVELGEVESVLSSHPEIDDVACIARENGAGEMQLVAYVVIRSGTASAKELREFLRERVPPHSIPSVFVPLTALPISPNGKVDRRALPAPSEVQVESNSSVRTARDPLELQLTLIFERFFQRRPIGIDVSFFELGGDSLQALKLVVEIERLVKKKLSLNVLYQASTIESLANVLRAEGNENWSSLVPLQPLGDRPPLFLVHTTPGDVLGYGNLIYHLHPSQPSFGFQSLGSYSRELSHGRIEEMAAHYIRLLRVQQPNGPYYLGGWCYGGIVAVEMAHQLLAAGQKVAPLFLIETPAPAPGLSSYFYYLRRIGRLLHMTPREWSVYLREKLNYYRGVSTENEKRFRRATEEDGFAPDELEARNRVLAQLEHVYSANLNALNYYRSRRYPGKVILFNAAEPDPALVRDPKYGWPGLAAEIEVHVIPGNHDTILMEPHVQVLAKRLTECLNEAHQ